MATFLGSPKAQYFDNNGNPLAGGKVYSYVGGTLTPTNTYPSIADALAFTNPNANPIILNSRGEATIVTAGTTKIRLTDADDNDIWIVDNITPGSSGNLIGPNGTTVIALADFLTSVNYLTVTNSILGANVKLTATGASTHIGLELETKGTSYVQALANSGLRIKRSDTGFYTALLTSSSQAANISYDLPATNTKGGLFNTTGNGVLEWGWPLPTGAVLWYGAPTGTPTGFLECDGAAVSRTTYAALFTALSTTFGVGDGSTTFNLPNIARRTLVGNGGSASAVLSSTVGSTGGTETHVLDVTEMPAHTHQFSNTFNNTGLGLLGTLAGGPTVGTITSTSTGGGLAHNNVQPSLIMRLIIKT